MRRKLSKSACEKWLQCPASFDYYYNQKIRPIKVGSALVFGIAIDNALNAVLLKSGDPLTEYQKAFDAVLLGKMVPHVNDYDGELLSDQQKTDLLATLKPLGYSGESIGVLYSALMDRIGDEHKKLSENQCKALDLVARASLFEKFKLMLVAYQKQVLPYIEEVVAVQKPSGPGYLDAKVKWHKRGLIIIDHKTASKKYPDNAVEYSVQLAMYAAEEQLNQVAYIIFLKQINKNRQKICVSCGYNGTGKQHKTCNAIVEGQRCNGEWTETIAPEAEIQIVHGEIIPEAMNVAAELQREVQRAVDAKIFPCNVGQCNSQFGRQCEYKNLKWKGSMDNLEKFEWSKKK